MRRKEWFVTLLVKDEAPDGEEFLDRIDIEDQLQRALTPNPNDNHTLTAHGITYRGVTAEITDTVEAEGAI